MSSHEWQPIETLDYGKRVLGVYLTAEGYWTAEVIHRERDLMTSWGEKFPATHWMPLPPAPSRQKEEA